MSQVQSNDNKLQALLARLCTNKETQKQLFEAITEEKTTAYVKASNASLQSLYDDKWKVDALGYMGQYDYLSRLEQFICNIK